MLWPLPAALDRHYAWFSELAAILLIFDLNKT